ncbi:hypothetical protein ACSD42_002188 [Cronobacter sakazakii]
MNTAKLKAVPRHSVDGYGRQDISYNDPEGEFVFYSDYEALKDALEAAHKRIAELESRTVTFKLPVTPEPSAYSPWVAKAFYQFHRDTVKSCFAVFSDACAAAGIKLEAE